VKEYLLEVPGENRFSNGSYQFSEKKNIVVSHNSKNRPQWDPYSYIKSYFNFSDKETFDWFKENFWIQDENFKKEKKQSFKKEYIFENFEQFRMKKANIAFKNLLVLRGLTHQFIEENIERIDEIAFEVWYCDSFFAGEKKPEKIGNAFVQDSTLRAREIFIFPWYDLDKKLSLIKIRWADGKTIFWAKSYSYRPEDYKGKWSLFYNKKTFSEKSVVLTEGEIDRLILQVLWFDNVLWNAGWVLANRNILKTALANTDDVIIAYDNDSSWSDWYHKLLEEFHRDIKKINFPERKLSNGDFAKDVNDFFRVGFNTKKQWEKFISEAEVPKKQNENPLFDDRILYDEEKMEFLDIKSMRIKTLFQLSKHYFMTPAELQALRKDKKIPSYKWICYLDGGKERHYNLLNKKDFCYPSETPELHSEIDFLINNLCWNNERNVEWLMKAILYKYTHLNDVYIPSVVFIGKQGTGKGIFLNLLKKIFWENNTLTGLKQDDIESRFSAYSGQKLIVEFKEIGVHRIIDGKRGMWKLKSIIMEDRIQVEKKGQDTVEIDNIAWFIMSSNDPKPLHLDGKTVWDRRFVFFNSAGPTGKKRGSEIAKIVRDKRIIENFLAYLFQKYPDIEKDDSIDTLENEEKDHVQMLSEGVGNLFFMWIEEKYPNVNKITNHEKNHLVEVYRKEIWETEHMDDRYFIRNFNNWLSIKYRHSVPFIDKWKTVRGYTIDKQVEWLWRFEEDIFSKSTKLEDLPF